MQRNASIIKYDFVGRRRPLASAFMYGSPSLSSPTPPARLEGLTGLPMLGHSWASSGGAAFPLLALRAAAATPCLDDEPSHLRGTVLPTMLPRPLTHHLILTHHNYCSLMMPLAVPAAVARP